MNKNIIFQFFFVITLQFIFCVHCLFGEIITITPEKFEKADLAAPGDTITFSDGIYKINLEIKDGINLTAENKGGAILEPLDLNKPVIKKYGSGTIENLVIRNADGQWHSSGLYLSNSDALVRQNEIYSNNPYGVYASFFDGQLIDNIIKDNKIDGIKIYHSGAIIKNNLIISNIDDGLQALHCNIKIDSNIFQNNGGAIEFWFDNKSTVYNNYFIKNTGDINYFAGANSALISNNYFDGNTADSVDSADSKKIEDKKEDGKMIPLTNYANSITSANQEKLNVNTVSSNFFSNPENMNSLLDLMMLKKEDFNLTFKQMPASDTIEIPVFTRLFQNTIETPEFLNILSDSFVNAAELSDKINILIKIDNISDSFESSISEKNKSEIISDLPDYFPEELEIYLNEICDYAEEYERCFNEFKSGFADTELEFIKDNILNVFSNTKKSFRLNMREELKNYNESDKENLKLKKLLDKINLGAMKNIGLKIIEIAEKIRNIDFTKIDSTQISGNILYETMTKFGKIIIGGSSGNYYANSDCFILIDLGGDDFYKNKIAASYENKLISIYIDLGGNDNYISDCGFDIASSVFGVSCLFDNSGGDIYSGANNSVSSSYFGISAISDASGNDNYQCGIYGLAAGLFGFSIIQDLNGCDVYNGGAYCEGFGSVKGYGLIIDYKGNDFYLSGNRIIDSLRYYSNSITMSQGCGFGIRPYIPGGLGMLVDYEGNDLYKADVYGQASAYWASVGCIADYSGDDKYIAHRYSQGAGIHLAIGCLLDFSGNDEYNNWEVGQGVGHDMAYGALYDKSGEDIYNMRYMGQGGGITNAIGILIDEAGNDGHYSIQNNLGYGEYFAPRGFGSIAVFFDKAGDDRYLNSKNNELKIFGKYGIFYDK
ncbi:MAG TPA: right-handed parallel beta-helix repeat-containing protein [bacterium]|nr:right-handed parallel beta-helix repeat-containing protein [bacterium]